MKSVYHILCKVNDKRYIGQTTNIERRFYHHKLALGNGTHYNKPLQNDWDKYGPDNFEFSILPDFATEQDALNKYNSLSYNTLVANGHGGSRINSGATRILVKPVRTTITLEKHQLDWLKTQGNVSEVIRDLIKTYLQERNE